MNRVSANALATYWFVGAAVICAILIAATALRYLGPQSGPTAWLLGRISLTAENNVGAWWSGMLLALLSLHAFDGYALLRRSDPGAARGWRLLASVLLFLSFDEVGSLHERVSLLGQALSLGTWRLLFLVAAVLAAVFLRAMVLLWRSEGERQKVRWIVFAFCLFGLVAVQEYLEHRIDWQTDATRAIRAAVEEGTELLAMLILLRIAVANTSALATRSSRPTVFAALHELRTLLVGIGLALTPALALGSATLTDQYRGHPADWLAAVAFLAAGLVLCRLYFRDGRSGASWATWIGGGLCCLASVASVGIPGTVLVELGSVVVSLRTLVLVGMSVLAGAACARLPAGRGWPYAAGAVGVGAFTVALLPFAKLALVYGLSQFLGLMIYWAYATAVEHVEPVPVPGFPSQEP